MDFDQAVTIQPTKWNDRYGEKHRWVRVNSWPPGLVAPKRVRLYQRAEHFLLNWWDPRLKKNCTERIAGDWLASVTRAKAIEQSLVEIRHTASSLPSRVSHSDLVAQFLANIARRADVHEVAARTVERYRSALEYYLEYCRLPQVQREFPSADCVNREFQLGLRRFLLECSVRPKADDQPGRPLRGSGFILDTVRAVYCWASDPDRGQLLPDTFRNPFLRGESKKSLFVGDPLTEPAISIPMAAEFLAAAEDDDKALFAPLILFGLRAAEPCFLFREFVTPEWLLVPNIPEIDYFTKGRRDKRFPWIEELTGLRDCLLNSSDSGLLYRRTNPYGTSRNEALSLAEYQVQYRKRLSALGALTYRDRARVQRQFHREVQGLCYDMIESRFRRITRRLGWTQRTTLKDFRHLFATTLANANLAEGYRKYLMGHAPNREASVAYTHLNRLREQFGAVLRTEYQPVLQVLSTWPINTVRKIAKDCSKKTGSMKAAGQRV